MPDWWVWALVLGVICFAYYRHQQEHVDRGFFSHSSRALHSKGVSSSGAPTYVIYTQDPNDSAVQLCLIDTGNVSVVNCKQTPPMGTNISKTGRWRIINAQTGTAVDISQISGGVPFYLQSVASEQYWHYRSDTKGLHLGGPSALAYTGQVIALAAHPQTRCLSLLGGGFHFNKSYQAATIFTFQNACGNYPPQPLNCCIDGSGCGSCASGCACFQLGTICSPLVTGNMWW